MATLLTEVITQVSTGEASGTRQPPLSCHSAPPSRQAAGPAWVSGEDLEVKMLRLKIPIVRIFKVESILTILIELLCVFFR